MWKIWSTAECAECAEYRGVRGVPGIRGVPQSTRSTRSTRSTQERRWKCGGWREYAEKSEGAEVFEVKGVAEGQEVAECRGRPRVANKNDGDVEQDERVEVDEDGEAR